MLSTNLKVGPKVATVIGVAIIVGNEVKKCVFLSRQVVSYLRMIALES